MTKRARNIAAIPAILVVLLLGTSIADAALNLISLNQEWQMRDEMHSQVASEYRLLNDRASLEYLNAVGRRIAGQTPLGNQRWDFFIVQDSAVNAFNVPGGLVYVNTGLIAEADSLEELAGVLAHEISHGSARHGTQLMTRAYGYNVLAGLLLGQEAGAGKQLLAQVVGTGILTNYSRNAEHEADRLGVQYITRAGYDPNGMVEFFGKLASMRQRQPSKVEQFFSSHPLTEERIRNVQGEISRVGNTDRLIDDTQSYQRFRARFR